MKMYPVLHSLRWLLVFFLSFSYISSQAQWSELGGSNALSANGNIAASVLDASGNLYVAGNFTNASGKYYVAKWNGTAWSELGGSNALAANSSIAALAVDAAGNVYAAGAFTNSSSKTYVAKYNGTAWSELGGSNTMAANSSINALAVDAAGNVYAAGGFYNSSTKCYVAKYDGISWSELGGSNSLAANGAIVTLTTDATGNVYAAGGFKNSSSKNYVAKYNGTSWSELGGSNALSANNSINAMAIDAAGNLYAAGDFTNSSSKRYVGKYNGTAWSELGGSNLLAANNFISALATDANGNVYAAGYFTNPSFGNYYIARYNGTGWAEWGGNGSFGPTSPSAILTLSVNTAGNVFMGGVFRNASSKYYVAVSAPAISSFTATSSTYNDCVGTAFRWQYFGIKAGALKGDVTVTAPAGFELNTVSSSATTGSSSVSFSPINGTIAGAQLYVRQITSATLGTHSGTVTLTSTDATTLNLSVTATLNAQPGVSISGTTTGCGSVALTASSPASNVTQYYWTGAGINTIYGSTASFTSSGTYTATASTDIGCISTASQTVTVKQLSSSTTNQTIITTQLPYSWNGLTFTAAGSKTAHLTNAAGCDSAATLNLIVNVPPPSFSYPSSSYSFTKGTAITPLTPTSTGGTITSGFASSSTQNTYSDGCFAADGLGNVYIRAAGNTAGVPYSATETQRYLLKVSPSGDTVNIPYHYQTKGFSSFPNIFDAENSTGILSNMNITADSIGNVYMVHSVGIAQSALLKIDPQGNQTNLSQQTNTYFSTGASVAVDRSGNVYVFDGNSSIVYKFLVNGTITSIDLSSYLISNGYAANQLAVDRGGNIYIAGYDQDYYGAVIKVDAQGNVSTFVTELQDAISLAVDAKDNVYYCDGGSIFMVPAGGNSINQTQLTALGYGYFGSIAADAFGNIYAFKVISGSDYGTADPSKGVIKKLAYGGYTAIPTLPTGLTIDATSGIISGTPTTITPVATYNIYGNNAGGTSKAALSIEVKSACVPTSSTTNAIICTGGSYLFNGTNYTTAGTYSASLTNAGGCDSTATLILVVNSCTNTWTGAQSTDWSNAANWSNGVVPTASTDIIVANTSRKPIISGTVNAQNVTILAGASLTVSGTLTVSGNWVNNGVAAIGNGTVSLSGTGKSITGYTVFTNLNIAGTYALGSTPADKIDITGILKKTSGQLTTNDKVTLKSTAAKTALIQEAGGSLVGKINMERFVGGTTGYHHLSSPVTNQIVGTWGKYFPITGKDGLRSGTLGQSGTLQEYREAANTKSMLDSGFYNYTNGDAAITSGKGYTAWFSKSATTLLSIGTPANGTINYGVTYRGSNATTRGWNFIGNPYPSPISWSALRSLNPGVWGDQACYIWKAAGGTNGNWQTYDGTVGTNGVGNVIASSQGFFVLVNKNASLLFDNSIRTTDLSPTFFGSTRLQQLRLQLVNPNNEAESDEVVAYTKAGITQPVVSVKPPMPAEATNASLSFLHEGKQAGIEALAHFKSGEELALNISTPVAGVYLLKVGDYNLTMSGYLKDAQTGHYTELKAGAEIAIATEATTSNTRYSIVFGRPAAAVAAANSAYKVFTVAKAIEVTNAVAVNNAKVVVYNTLGQQIATATMNGTRLTIPLSAQTNATYLVRIVGENVVKVIVH